MTPLAPLIWFIVSALVLLLVGVIAHYLITTFVPAPITMPLLLGAGIVLLLILLLLTLRYFGVA